MEVAVHNLDVCHRGDWKPDRKSRRLDGTLIWKNDPPSRTNVDGYTLSYEHQNAMKISFTANFLHPSGLLAGGQYTHVFYTKGPVSLDNGKFYPLERDRQPVLLSASERKDDLPHYSAFSRRSHGSEAPADIRIGVTAAKPFTRQAHDLGRAGASRCT